MATILEVKDLQIDFITYEGVAKVANGINITLGEGESAALVGETGCGKSVTAKSILGILPSPPGKIAGGEIIFHGKDLLKMEREGEVKAVKILRSTKMAMVPQHPMIAINPVFTIGDQLIDKKLFQGEEKVNWFRYFRDRSSKEKRVAAEKAAIDMLEAVKIPSAEVVMKSYPHQLSGGMRQRVLIAMALMGNPSLLVADEPGSALDVTIQDQVLQLLHEHTTKRNLAVIYITHNLGVARRLGGKMYVMYAGAIAEYGPTNAVLRNPMHPYSQGLLRSVPTLSEEMGEGIAGRVPNYVNPPSGCRFHPRCDHRMGICSLEIPEAVEVEPNHWVHCYLFKK